MGSLRCCSSIKPSVSGRLSAVCLPDNAVRQLSVQLLNFQNSKILRNDLLENWCWCNNNRKPSLVIDVEEPQFAVFTVRSVSGSPSSAGAGKCNGTNGVKHVSPQSVTLMFCHVKMLK